MDERIKLKIRGSDTRVKAVLWIDESDFYLGEISRPLAEFHPEIFEAWKKLMSEAMVKMIESTSDLKVKGYHETKPPPDH